MIVNLGVISLSLYIQFEPQSKSNLVLKEINWAERRKKRKARRDRNVTDDGRWKEGKSTD